MSSTSIEPKSINGIHAQFNQHQRFISQFGCTCRHPKSQRIDGDISDGITRVPTRIAGGCRGGVGRYAFHHRRAVWTDFFIPWMGQWQWLVRLLAASYLIWWAIQLWNRSTLSHTSPDQSLPASHKNSLLLGFTLTLADTKAILFYIGFLPTWVDSSRLTPFDISIILLITLVAVGGVKALYAFFAATAGQIHFTSTVPEWNKWAAVMLLIISVVILLNPVK